MIAEREVPDLLVLDMMMPKKSGFLVLEKLRSRPGGLIPTIMITGNEGSRHRAYAEMLGVRDYIRKPFAMEKLVRAVEKSPGRQAAARRAGRRLTNGIFAVKSSRCTRSNSSALPLLARLGCGKQGPDGKRRLISARSTARSSSSRERPGGADFGLAAPTVGSRDLGTRRRRCGADCGVARRRTTPIISVASNGSTVCVVLDERQIVLERQIVGIGI